MWKSFTILFSLWVLLLSSCVKEETEGSPFRVEAGDALPSFSVTLNNGKTISHETLAGKTSVLVFFHTECPDCQKELPVMQRVYKRFEFAEEVEILAISRAEGFTDIQNYWSLHQLSIPFSAQPDRSIYEKFSHTGIPLIVIADQDLIIRKVWGDEQLPTETELLEAIEQLLQ